MSHIIETFSDQIHELVKEISFNRAKVIDDFCKAYLAHLSDKIPIENIFDKIELVEQWSEDRMSIKWYFREKQ